MSRNYSILRNTGRIPDSWIAAMGVFFLGALAGLVGAGVLTPFGYDGYGTALLWAGVGTMIATFVIVAAIFLRLWKPPGVAESEW